MKRALILFAHGSADPRWRCTFEALLADVEAEVGKGVVKLAYMEFCEPDLLSVCLDLYINGTRYFTLLPLFLSAGAHVAKDIPKQVEEVKYALINAELVVLPPIGEHASFAKLLRREIIAIILSNK